MLYNRKTRNKLTGLWARFTNAQKKYETKEITEKEYIKKLDDIELLACELDIQNDGDIKDYNNLRQAMDNSLLVYGIKSKQILALKNLEDIGFALCLKNYLLEQINSCQDKDKLKKDFEEEYKATLRNFEKISTSLLYSFHLMKALYIMKYLYGHFIIILNNYEKIEDKHLQFVDNLMKELRS